MPLALTLTLLSPTALVTAAPPTSWVTTRSNIEASLERLESAERALESAYGFNGSKVTARRAIADAGLRGGSSNKVPGRIYVVWRKLQPFFSTQRENLTSQLTAWPDTAQVPPHEFAWLGSALKELDAYPALIEADLKALLRLNIEHLLIERELSEAKANVLATRRAMSGVGSLAMKDLLAKAEQAVAEHAQRLAAASASLVAYEEACAEKGQALFIPRFAPPSERALHTISSVSLGEVDEEQGSLPAALTEDLVTLNAEVERETQTQEALQRDAAQKAEQATGDAARVDDIVAELRSVTGPVDLPEVRDVMTRRGEIEARIEAQREVIKGSDTSTPEGSQAAERATQEVLRLQTVLPGLDAELTRLRSKAHMLSWRERRQGALAKARSAAHLSLELSQRASESALKADVALRDAKGRLLEGALGLQATELTLFTLAVKGFPELTSLEVSRPGAAGNLRILTVLKPRRSVLIETVSDLQNTRNALEQSRATLASAWRLYAARSESVRSLPFPAPSLTGVVAEVWKGSVKRLALKTVGKGKRASALRDAFTSPPKLEDMHHWRAMPHAMPAGDLALALQRFETALASKATQRSLARASYKALERYGFKGLAPSSEEVQAVATYLAFLASAPLMHLAAGAYEQASGEARQLSEVVADLAKGLSPLMAGRPHSEGALRVGDPVDVTLTFGDRRASGCPTLSLATHEVRALGKRSEGRCAYHLPRLPPLPAGAVSLVVAPSP